MADRAELLEIVGTRLQVIGHQLTPGISKLWFGFYKKDREIFCLAWSYRKRDGRQTKEIEMDWKSMIPIILENPKFRKKITNQEVIDYIDKLIVIREL